MRKPKIARLAVNPFEAIPLPIVGDAAIATAGVGEGRMIPLVILDTSQRPDLEEFIRLHTFVKSGDVTCRWCRLEGRPDTVSLLLTFVKPAELIVLIEFDMELNHGILVEQIMTTRGLYVQAGRPGDRFGHDVDRPKLILEIPDTGYRPQWDALFERSALKRFRAKGLSRPDAKRAARNLVEEIRRMAKLRMEA